MLTSFLFDNDFDSYKNYKVYQQYFYYVEGVANLSFIYDNI